MKKVLFVDDEPNILAGIGRMLYPLRKEWMMVFASNGREALDYLAVSDFDVLVTDVRMPEVDGIELLTEVIRLYPRIVRIVLSGTADHDMTLRSISLAHQYLMKPCDAETLLRTLCKALSLRNILDDPALTALIGRIRSLPSVPTVYRKLMNAVQSADVSAAEIGGIVSQDLGLSVKVLQWVNSPLFGRKCTVAGPKEAAIYLGAETLKAMAVTEAVFSQFDTKGRTGLSADELRDHCFQVATRAQEIARTRGLPQSVVDDVFLGGLLHDIGKLVLSHNFPLRYRDLMLQLQDPEGLGEAERQVFGATHADVGGYLLWLWGFPETVTDIVLRHHRAGPETDEVQDPAGIVYLADMSVRQAARLQADRDAIGGKIAV